MKEPDLLRHVGHRYPLYSGYLKVLRAPGFRSTLEGPGPAWATLRDGSMAQVRMDEPIGRAMYFLGDYDPKVTWLLRRLLRPGDEVVDIGANVGVYALQAARIVGEHGAVHAIEPQSALCDLLRASVARNAYDWVRVHQVALSDRTGTVTLFTKANSAVASLADDGAAAGTEPVASVHAGEFLGGLTNAPRLLKIDVEGHEATVLAAAGRWLDDARPPAIVFESHAVDGPFWDRPLVRLLAPRGYTFAQVPKAKVAMHLVDVPVGSDVGPGFDFIAMQPAVRAELGAAVRAATPAGRPRRRAPGR